jgi:hypothetical protein
MSGILILVGLGAAGIICFFALFYRLMREWNGSL